MPIWVNEGLAEYFGESVFTGDGFVTGVIPQARLERVQDSINNGRFRSIERMMRLSHEQWNREMSADNYDQAWSMVQFLAHGEDGKYQKAFGAFMRAINRGRASEQAWNESFGNSAQFEDRWKEFWLGLPRDPTAQLYAQASASTVASYLGRAHARRQTFASFELFREAAEAGKIEMADKDWLPPGVLRQALAMGQGMGRWSIEETSVKTPQVVLLMEDGTRLTASFTVRAGRVDKVSVNVDDTLGIIMRAKAAFAEGRKEPARAMLQKALRDNPRSPHAEAARDLLVEMK